MNTKNIFAAVSAIAVSNPFGFTVDAKNLQPVKKGFAVAVSGTQNSFGDDGLKKVIKYAGDHPEINAFGGWLNSDNNEYYYDATIICDNLESALEIGRANNQIAIFDLENLKEIRL